MATVFCFVVFGAFVDVGGAEFQLAHILISPK
jgi:hypothetical protein